MKLNLKCAGRIVVLVLLAASATGCDTLIDNLGTDNATSTQKYYENRGMKHDEAYQRAFIEDMDQKSDEVWRKSTTGQ